MNRSLLAGLMLALLLCGYSSANAIFITVTARTADGDNEKEKIYQPLDSYGLTAVVSYSSDYSDTIYQAVANAAAYGSDRSSNSLLGVEPMADTEASVIFVDPTKLYWNPFAVAAAAVSIRHRIQPAPGADPNVVNTISEIKLKLDYEMETSIDSVFNSTASAAIAISGPGVSLGRSINGNDEASGTFSFSAPYTATGIYEYLITASAGSTANFEIRNDGQGAYAAGGSAQAVADPFLFVDPDWNYASLFRVVQESYNSPGQWIEVTRDWREDTNVPEPATVALLSIGLAGLVATRRRRTVLPGPHAPALPRSNVRRQSEAGA